MKKLFLAFALAQIIVKRRVCFLVREKHKISKFYSLNAIWEKLKLFTTSNTIFKHSISFMSIILTLTILNCQEADCADEWDKARLSGSALINDIDTDTQKNNTALDRLLSTYDSINLSYTSGSTITASAGSVTC